MQYSQNIIKMKKRKHEIRFTLNIEQAFCVRAASTHRNDSNNTNMRCEKMQRATPKRNKAAHKDTHSNTARTHTHTRTQAAQTKLFGTL